MVWRFAIVDNSHSIAFSHFAAVMPGHFALVVGRNTFVCIWLESGVRIAIELACQGCGDVINLINLIYYSS